MLSYPARDTARNLSREATYNNLTEEAEFWGEVAQAFNKKEKALPVDVVENAIHAAMKKIEECDLLIGVADGGIMTDKAMMDRKKVSFLIEKLEMMKHYIRFPPYQKKKAQKKPA